MNKNEEQLKRRAGHIRLTDAEKNSMRFAIDEHMRLNPLGSVKSSWGVWMPGLRFAAPALAAILLFTGTAYAAEGALPGDLLYPIKIHVNEPVEVALATTPEAKADVEAQIAQTRVAEAQALAANGTLDATTTEELQNSFNAYATDAIAEANQAEPATTTPAVTASTTTMATAFATTSTATSTENGNFASRLKVSLDAQASILNTLGIQVGLGIQERRDGHASSTPEHPQTSLYRRYEGENSYGDTHAPMTGAASTSSATSSVTSTPAISVSASPTTTATSASINTTDSSDDSSSNSSSGTTGSGSASGEGSEGITVPPIVPKLPVSL